jgi:type IV pilus assembly protein PilP
VKTGLTLLAASTLNKLSTAVILALMMSACGGGDGDDLDQFMRDATKNAKPKVQPLPEVKPYEALVYNQDGVLSDPFHVRKAASKGSGTQQPDLKRPKEPLESYPLESIKYVGMLSKRKLTYALLRTPDNTVQQVTVGNYIGQNYGRITAIADNEVTLHEIVQDELTGDWVNRTTKLALQE